MMSEQNPVINRKTSKVNLLKNIYFRSWYHVSVALAKSVINALVLLMSYKRHRIYKSEESENKLIDNLNGTRIKSCLMCNTICNTNFQFSLAVQFSKR